MGAYKNGRASGFIKFNFFSIGFCWQQWVPVKRVCDEDGTKAGRSGGRGDLTFQNWFPGMLPASTAADPSSHPLDNRKPVLRNPSRSTTTAAGKANSAPTNEHHYNTHDVKYYFNRKKKITSFNNI